MSEQGFRIKQLENLPDEWAIVTLKYVFDEVNVRVNEYKDGNADKFEVLSLTKNDGLIPQSKRFKKRIATDDVGNYKVVQRGQIVYNPYVIWEGAIHILRNFQFGLVSPAYPVLSARDGIADPYYLDDLLRTPLAINAYNRFAAGAVNRRRAISKRDFRKIEIPLPPLPEQQAIAHVMTTVRQAIEATERVIEAARELKRSMMKYLFTYGPVPIDQADKVLLKDTEIGEIPEEWTVEALKEVVTFTKKPGTLDLSLFDKIPFIPMDAIPTDSQLPTYYIEKAPAEISSGIYVERGDIVLAKITPSFENGKQAIVDTLPTEFAYATTEVFPIRPYDNSQVDTLFLFHYLRRQKVRNFIAGKMEGTTGRQRVPKAVVKDTPLPIPRIQDQLKIVKLLDSVDKKIQMETKRKSTIETLFNSLLHHMMTGKIRVQV